MKKALGAAPGSKVVGVNPTEGASVRNTEAMKKALGEAAGNQVVGVNRHGDSVKLSPEQRKAMKDALVNPGVNHDNQTDQKKVAHVAQVVAKMMKMMQPPVMPEPKKPTPPKPH